MTTTEATTPLEPKHSEQPHTLTPRHGAGDVGEHLPSIDADGWQVTSLMVRSMVRLPLSANDATRLRVAGWVPIGGGGSNASKRRGFGDLAKVFRI